MKRHPANPNLHLYTDEFFHGLRVYTTRGPLVLEYLERGELVIQAALHQYARVTAFRFDLHLPSWYRLQDESYPNAVLERFIASLKAKIEHNRAQASRVRSGVHQTTVRHLWTREFGTQGLPHFHVTILVNGDAFTGLGEYVLGRDNMYNRVVEALSSALHASCAEVVTLVHFPERPVHWLRRDDPQSYADLFYRVSYFCKAETKQYQDRGHAFGYSRH